MTYIAQLEREAERQRRIIEGTLESLRSSVRPKAVFDDILEVARSSAGADFVENLKRQVVNNPLPVAIVGAGLSWLAFASKAPPSDSERWRYSGRSPEYKEKEPGDVAGAAAGQSDNEFQRTKETAVETAHSMSESAQQTAANIASTAHAAAERLKEGAGTAYSSASEAAGRLRGAVSQSIATTRERVTNGSRSTWAFCREQPLVLAGLGLAIGAAIGAALPATMAEDRLLGKTANQVKEKISRVLRNGTDEISRVAKDTWDTAGKNEVKAYPPEDRSGNEHRERSFEGETPEISSPSSRFTPPTENGEDAEILAVHDSSPSEDELHHVG